MNGSIWQAWRLGVREARFEDGRTWTPEDADNFMALNEAYDRGRNAGRAALNLPQY